VLGVRERGGDGHAAGGKEVEELVDDLQQVVAGQGRACSGTAAPQPPARRGSPRRRG
jgi:hypothetical protein